MLELVLGKEGLGVSPKQPPQHLLPRVAHPQTHVANRRFERFVVAQASTSERLLDRVVEVVDLKLRHPPSAVPPDTKRAQHVALTHSCSEQDWKRLEHRDIFLSYVFVPSRPWQTHGHVQRLEGLERDADVPAELGEGAVRPRESSPRALEVAERQVSRR
jgi:hypothetical protein